MKAKKAPRTRNSGCFNPSQSNSYIKSVDDSKTMDNISQCKNSSSGSRRKQGSFALAKCAANVMRKATANNNSTYLELETESEKEQTPIKTKIQGLQSSTKAKNFIVNDTFNTRDHAETSRNQIVEDFKFEGRTFDNRVEWKNDNKDDLVDEEDDEDADINDS